MRQLLILILSGVLIAGCKKEYLSPDDGVAYYQFSTQETAQILKAHLGDTLVYKNQAGGSMIFGFLQADSNIKGRYTQGVGFFGPDAASYFFYDAISYRFVIPSRSIEMRLSFRKWPIRFDSAKANINRLFSAKLYTQIDFPFWNSYSGTSFLVPESPDTSLQIANNLYSKVVRILSDNPNQSDTFHKVNTLYYSYKHGIIGFDDREGNEWRLQP